MVRLENVKAGTVKMGAFWVRFEEYVRGTDGRRVIDGERFLTAPRKVTLLSWVVAR